MAFCKFDARSTHWLQTGTPHTKTKARYPTPATWTPSKLAFHSTEIRRPTVRMFSGQSKGTTGYTQARTVNQLPPTVRNGGDRPRSRKGQRADYLPRWVKHCRAFGCQLARCNGTLSVNKNPFSQRGNGRGNCPELQTTKPPARAA